MNRIIYWSIFAVCIICLLIFEKNKKNAVVEILVGSIILFIALKLFG